MAIMRLVTVMLLLLLAPAQATAEDAPDCCVANINELVKKLDGADCGQRGEALSKLGLYGAEAGSAVPALIQHLGNQEDLFRTVAVLGKIGPPAKAAVPELVLLLNGALNNTDKYSSEVTLSLGIISALSQIREHKELIVPVLRKAIDHPYSCIRYQAAHALGQMGAAARIAAPDLKRLSIDNERPPLYTFPYGETVGAAAKFALDKVQPRRP